MSPRPLASEPAIVSPYLTAKEAAAYLKFRSVGALYAALKPQQIPVLRRGVTLLFDRAELDAWLRRERHTPQCGAVTEFRKGRAS